jgi:hypothetical protein
MTALQSIIKEAKSLRAKYPKRFSKWTDYVKQASAIYASKHKGKSPVGKKKVVKKKIAKKKVAKKKIVKKAIGKKKIAKKSIAKKPTEIVILKKVHSAKTTSKNLFNKLDKLDEAQHNYMMGKIGVIKKMEIDHYHQILHKIDILEKSLINNNLALKKTKNSEYKKLFKNQIAQIKKYLSELKIQKSELKKLL